MWVFSCLDELGFQFLIDVMNRIGVLAMINTINRALLHEPGFV